MSHDDRLSSYRALHLRWVTGHVGEVGVGEVAGLPSGAGVTSLLLQDTRLAIEAPSDLRDTPVWQRLVTPAQGVIGGSNGVQKSVRPWSQVVSVRLMLLWSEIC